MVWNLVEPNIWKPINEDDAVIGILLKSDKNDKYDNNVYHIEHSGKNYIVFGTTVLDRKMEHIEVGDIIKIVYKGIEKNKKNQDTKMFDVYKGSTEDLERSGIKEEPQEIFA